MVLCAAKSEDREKDKRKENQTDPEAGALSEVSGYVDVQNDYEDKVDEGYEQQNEPPARASGDFAQDVKIVERYEDGPAGLAGFGEHLPHRGDHEKDDRDINDPEYRTGPARGGRIIGSFLCKQGIHSKQKQDISNGNHGEVIRLVEGAGLTNCNRRGKQNLSRLTVAPSQSRKDKVEFRKIWEQNPRFFNAALSRRGLDPIFFSLGYSCCGKPVLHSSISEEADC